MDLVAALALVMVLEGLALVVMARSLPELLAALEEIEPAQMRMIGAGMLALGAVLYMIVRG